MRARPIVRRGVLSASAAVGALALALAAAGPASATLNDDGSVTVDLLSFTDFHGELRAAPNMAQQVNAIRAANPDTILSSAGDNIGGSTFESAFYDDEPTIEALNAMGLDVSVVGNHEFDRGYPDLRDRIEPLADFDHLAANVEGQDDLDGVRILETANGVNVAYIGTVTLQTPSVVSASGIAGLTFTDPVDTTNRIAAELSQDEDVDVIVALTHEATGVVRDGLSDDVDVVFTGHSHETIPTIVPTPANTTPRPVAYTDGGAPIVQAGASGSVLGHVELTVAADGTITYGDVANLPVTQISQQLANGGAPVTGERPDPATDPDVLEVVQQTYEVAGPAGAEPVGTLGAPFLAASNEGRPSTGTPQHRGAESPLGNLIAEIAYETAIADGVEADFGIVNPGGIRADLVPGENGVVTVRQAFNVTSFGNPIGTRDLTGAQVVTLLEQQFLGQGSRPMLALGLSPQLSYLYDPSAPVGERIVDVAIVDESGLGTPIDPEGTYTVASNLFLLEGQDGFTVLRDGTNPQDVDDVRGQPSLDWRATIDYLGLPDNAGLTPTYQQQSIGFTPVTDLEQEFAPGDEITIDLSSLSFTNTEPKPTTVTAVVLGSDLPSAAPQGLLAADDLDQVAAEPGTVIGSAPVSNENVLDSNETGRSTVTITIPTDTETGTLTIGYFSSDESADTLLPEQLVAGLAIPVVADAEVPPTEEPEETAPPTAPAPTDPEDIIGDADGSDGGSGAGGGAGSLDETGSDAGWLVGGIALLAVLAGLGMLVRRRATS